MISNTHQDKMNENAMIEDVERPLQRVMRTLENIHSHLTRWLHHKRLGFPGRDVSSHRQQYLITLLSVLIDRSEQMKSLIEEITPDDH